MEFHFFVAVILGEVQSEIEVNSFCAKRILELDRKEGKLSSVKDSYWQKFLELVFVIRLLICVSYY